jgi:ABC-type transporter Mla subunit MlaD
MFGEGITGAGNVSVEVAALEKIGHAAEDIKSNLKGIEDSLVSRLTNLQSLKNVMNTTIDKLVDVVKVNDTNGTGEANARIIKDVHDKLNDEFNNQMKNLQTVLNLKLKPTSDDLMALIKDNNKFQVLAERLGVNYNTPEASDRLALAYTNMSKLQLNAKKVEDALKTLEISLDKYKSLKTVEELKKVLSEVLKNNTGKSSEVLSKVLSAIKTLKGTFKDHSKLIKELRGAMEDAYVDGGDYSTGVGRVRSTTAKSTLKTRVKTYENTLKELFKNMLKMH